MYIDEIGYPGDGSPRLLGVPRPVVAPGFLGPKGSEKHADGEEGKADIHEIVNPLPPGDDDSTTLSSCGKSASLAQSCSFHSLFKLEQSVFLVKLLWHVRVWMMLVEELYGMES